MLHKSLTVELSLRGKRHPSKPSLTFLSRCCKMNAKFNRRCIAGTRHWCQQSRTWFSRWRAFTSARIMCATRNFAPFIWITSVTSRLEPIAAKSLATLLSLSYRTRLATWRWLVSWTFPDLRVRLHLLWQGEVVKTVGKFKKSCERNFLVFCQLSQSSVRSFWWPCEANLKYFHLSGENKSSTKQIKRL